MKQIVLNIKDDSKITAILNFFKTISFIEVSPRQSEAKKERRGNFESLFGIRKDRDISVDKIRTKAWVKR